MLNLFMIIAGWTLLSSAFSASITSLQFRALKSYDPEHDESKPVFLPCLLAASYLSERAGSRMRRDHVSKYLFRELFFNLFLFGLPERIISARVSRACERSGDNDDNRRHVFGHRHHWCHESREHVYPLPSLDAMVISMGYENLSSMKDGGTLMSKLKSDDGGVFAIIEQCRDLEEADAVATLVRRQIVAETESLKETLGMLPSDSFFASGGIEAEQTMRDIILGRDNIIPIADAFKTRVDENPDLPLEILVELSTGMEVGS